MGEEDDDLPFREESPSTPATPSTPPTPPEPERSEGDKKRLFERAIPEILKRVVERAVESGANRLVEGPENLRHFLHEAKLPKEVLHYLYTQIDDTKNGLYRVVAKEIRDVLEHTKFADELTAALTKLSFEIKTEIRFIPNDTAKPPSSKKDHDGDDEGEGGGKLPKPEVTSHISVKDRSKDARR